MIGLALIAVGAVCLWAAFTGRATAVLSALKMDLPVVGAGNAIETPSSDGGGSDSMPSGDSGQHSAMTPGGLIYVINKAYGDMSDEEKDDANSYAHHVGNLGSTG